MYIILVVVFCDSLSCYFSRKTPACSDCDISYTTRPVRTSLTSAPLAGARNQELHPKFLLGDQAGDVVHLTRVLRRGVRKHEHLGVGIGHRGRCNVV